jgi:hypothetical protein
MENEEIFSFVSDYLVSTKDISKINIIWRGNPARI